MNSVVSNIENAKKIINNDLTFSTSLNDKTVFHKHSYVYRTTNEMISSRPYINALKDKERILSVVASGDQILNSILYGSKNIDGFDISVFPKYYLELKKAGIMNLSREQFISFFLGEVTKYKNNPDTFNVDIYNSIRNSLDYEYKLFWDSLFFDKDYGNFFPNYILNSNFFDSPHSKVEFALENNPYLEENNYYLLRDKLNSVDINYYDIDIFEAGESLRKNYDLINLSSIFVANSIGNLDVKHDEFFKKLHISDKGIILSYIFQCDIYVYNFLKEKIVLDSPYYNFETLKDRDGVDTDGIVTYSKCPKVLKKY